jgi:hypothetical protein
MSAARQTHHAGHVEITIVDDEAGFDALESIWSHLEQAMADPVPCQRWDWARTWWRVYARACDRPFIVVVGRDGVTVGLLPLYLRDANRAWGRRLRLIATGEPESEEVASEFLDVLAAPSDRALVASAALQALAESALWREIELRNVLESAAVARAWPESRFGSGHGEARGLRYAVDLTQAWGDYLATLSSRFRSRVRAQVRAFDTGEQQLVEAAVHEIDTVLAQLIRLHEQRWHGRNRAGAFGGERFRAFHRALLGTWVPRREATLRRLVSGGSETGVLYNFHWARREFYYQSGLAIDTGRSGSPGLGCHVGAMLAARALNFQSYDFMLGRATSYKASYACATTGVADFRHDRRGAVQRMMDRALAVCGTD